MAMQSFNFFYLGLLVLRAADAKEAEAEPATSQGSYDDSYDSQAGIPSNYLPIQSQGSCGSCWSFSATEMLSARILKTKLASDFESWGAVVSPQIPVSFPQYSGAGGCDGGWPYKVGNMVKSKGGLPDLQCAPYLSGSCSESADNKTHNGCHAETWGTCWGSSSSWNNWGYSTSAYITDVKQISGESEYKADIMQNGDLSVSFNYYKEFGSYKSGIMTHATPDSGGHAVLITGWGNEDGTPFWRIRNSWGASWGESGYCRMLRGQNFANIESTGASFVLGSDEPETLNDTFVHPEGAYMPGGWVERSVGDEPVVEALAALQGWANEQSIDFISAQSQIVQGMHVSLHVRASSRHLKLLTHKPPVYRDDANGLPQFKIVRVEDISESIGDKEIIV